MSGIGSFYYTAFLAGWTNLGWHRLPGLTWRLFEFCFKMALPKKRKFSRRSVSKVVRLNHVYRTKNRSVGLQPELMQVSLKCYFFSSLQGALLSNLYTYIPLLLGSLNSYYVGRTIINVTQLSSVFLFKAPSHFNFNSSKFVFNELFVYVKNTPALMGVISARQQISRDCLWILGGGSALNLLTHQAGAQTSVMPDVVGPSTNKAGNPLNKPFSLKSRLSQLLVTSCRRIIRGQRNLSSQLVGYLSRLTFVSKWLEHTPGTPASDVFRKFFIHTAFHKKVQ